MKRKYTFQEEDDAREIARNLSDDALEDLTSTTMEDIVAEPNKHLKEMLTHTLVILDKESIRRERNR